jgi:hypothetical protein
MFEQCLTLAFATSPLDTINKNQLNWEGRDVEFGLCKQNYKRQCCVGAVDTDVYRRKLYECTVRPWHHAPLSTLTSPTCSVRGGETTEVLRRVWNFRKGRSAVTRDGGFSGPMLIWTLSIVLVCRTHPNICASYTIKISAKFVLAI